MAPFLGLESTPFVAVIGWATSPVVGWSGGGHAKPVGSKKWSEVVVVLCVESERVERGSDRTVTPHMCIYVYVYIMF